MMKLTYCRNGKWAHFAHFTCTECGYKARTVTETEEEAKIWLPRICPVCTKPQESQA